MLVKTKTVLRSSKKSSKGLLQALEEASLQKQRLAFSSHLWKGNIFTINVFSVYLFVVFFPFFLYISYLCFFSLCLFLLRVYFFVVFITSPFWFSINLL